MTTLYLVSPKLAKIGAIAIALALTVPAKADIGIYTRKPQITLVNTGVWYRDNFNSYKAPSSRINMRGLGEYIIIDIDTGESASVTYSQPRSVASLDLTRRPIAYGPINVDFYFTQRRTIPSVSFLSAAGRGKVTFIEQTFDTGDADRRNGNDTTVFTASASIGSVSTFKVRSSNGLVVTVERVPKAIVFDAGYNRHHDLAVSNGSSSVGGFLTRDGETYEHGVSRSIARLHARYTAIANDLTQASIAGYSPKTFNFGLALVKQILEDSGFEELELTTEHYQMFFGQ